MKQWLNRSLPRVFPSSRVSYRDPNAPVESGHRGGHQSRPSVPLDKGIEVLVSFHSKQHDIVLNEEFLLSYFSQFGHVADCVVKSFSRNTVNLQKKNGAKQGGYGFVVFTDASAAGHVIAQFQQRMDVTVVVQKQQRDKVGEPLPPDGAGRTIVVTIQCHLSHASEEAMQRRQRENLPPTSASSSVPSAMAHNPTPTMMMNAPVNHLSPMTAPPLFLPMNMPGGYYVNEGPQPNNMNANGAMGYGTVQPQFVHMLSASPPQAPPTPLRAHMSSPLQQAQMSPDMAPQYTSQTYVPPQHAQFAPYPNVQSFPQPSYPSQQWTTVPSMPYPPMGAPRLQPPMSYPSPIQPGLNYHVPMSPSQTPLQQQAFAPQPTFVVAAQGSGPIGPIGPNGLLYSPHTMHAGSPSHPSPHGAPSLYTQQGQARPPQHH